MSSTVLVAGATGNIGLCLVEALIAGGHNVRALARDPRPCQQILERIPESPSRLRLLAHDALSGAPFDEALDDVDIVVSTIGGSVSPTRAIWKPASFARSDTRPNLALLAAAEKAGVSRFVYLSVHPASGYDQTRYLLAHTAVENALQASSLSTTAVRPTGLFASFVELKDFARWGVMPLIGDGSARTNPVHERDVAELCVKHLTDGPELVSIGGPEILTRRQLVEIAFEALGRKTRTVPVPPSIVRASAAVQRLFHPHLGELVEFLAAVSTHDAVAPEVGSQRFRDYLAE